MPIKEPAPSQLDRARIALGVVIGEQSEEFPDYDKMSRLVAIAQAHALIAVAEELDRLRSAVGGVAENLTDRDGHSAGTHLYYISDWLKDLVEKR